MEKAFFARIFALPQWQRRGEKRRGRGKGRGRVEGALSRWCTSEIPMLFSLLPRFTFPGITDNAFYCSWMLFLRSIRIQLRNFIFLKRFRLFTRAHLHLPPRAILSLPCQSTDVKASKHQLSTYFQNSNLYVHLGETFDRYIWKISLMLNEIKVKKFPILRDRIERLASFN